MSGDLNVEGADHAQQAVQGSGSQFNTFYSFSLWPSGNRAGRGRGGRLWRSRRRSFSIVMSAALLVTTMGPGADPAGSRPFDPREPLPAKIGRSRQLVIGVRDDLPGLGLFSGGEFLGFEVDVARYIAGRLGVPREGIGFKALSAAGRERALVEGTVDLVVASYSITPDRKERVGFAGPYYTGHKDLMVRAHDTRIRTVEDLSGKRMCKTRSAAQLIDRYGLRATLVGDGLDLAKCASALAASDVDALTGEDLILAGFAADWPGYFRLLGLRLSDERYGVGIRRGDTAGCEAVNEAIASMYRDGAAARLLGLYFGKSGFGHVVGPAPPVPDTCA